LAQASTGFQVAQVAAAVLDDWHSDGAMAMVVVVVDEVVTTGAVEEVRSALEWL